MNKLFHFGAVFILLLTAACTEKETAKPTTITTTGSSTGSSGTTGQQQAAYLMPLKKGNYWKYRTTTYRENGTVIGTNDTHEEIVLEEMNGTEVLYKSNTGTYYANRSDGLYMGGKSPALWVKHPMKRGDSYMVGGNNGQRVTLITDQMRIDVPKGSFWTYQYRFGEPNSSYAYMYYAPNGGLIRVDEMEKRGDGSGEYIASQKVLIEALWK